MGNPEGAGRLSMFVFYSSGDATGGVCTEHRPAGAALAGGPRADPAQVAGRELGDQAASGVPPAPWWPSRAPRVAPGARGQAAGLVMYTGGNSQSGGCGGKGGFGGARGVGPD